VTPASFGFVTCVQLGLSVIEEIYDVGGTLDFVLTLKDSQARTKSGRVYLDAFCRERRIELVKVANINDDEAMRFLEARRPDWLFIIGWSQIARPPVLAVPRRGALGMHPTLLPTGRGRAAVPWAILKDLRETGVTLFQLDEGVDSGPVFMQERIPLASDETATRLYARVSDAHRTLIRRAWPDLTAGRLTGVPQDETRATYWPKRTPADGELLSSMTTVEMDRLVRATTRPYPGAFWRETRHVVRVWAGRIPERGEAPPPGAYRLPACDGPFEATDFEIEPREHTPSSLHTPDPRLA
jgi:methionyl-tRNA formyltransferase